MRVQSPIVSKKPLFAMLSYILLSTHSHGRLDIDGARCTSHSSCQSGRCTHTSSISNIRSHLLCDDVSRLGHATQHWHRGEQSVYNRLVPLPLNAKGNRRVARIHMAVRLLTTSHLRSGPTCIRTPRNTMKWLYLFIRHMPYLAMG